MRALSNGEEEGGAFLSIAVQSLFTSTNIWAGFFNFKATGRRGRF